MKIIIEKNSKFPSDYSSKEREKFLEPEDEYSRFELESIQGQNKIIELLTQCIEQLKVANHFLTPAKSIGASGTEKSLARYRVAERILYHLKEIQNNK